MIGLLIIGLLFVAVDVALLAGIILQNTGAPMSWLFAPRPTPAIEPTIQIAPLAGEPGVTISVLGRGWTAHGPITVQLEDGSGALCPPEIVATPVAAGDGSFGTLITYPTSGCWTTLSQVRVVARSTETDVQAWAEFSVLAVMQTPTPTAVETLIAEPTATPVQPTGPQVTPTLVAEPTAAPTPITEPTATATPTVEPTTTPIPTAPPTALSETTPVPSIVDWRGEYFDNVNLVGDARLVRNDRVPDGKPGLSFDWGLGAPASGLPADGFSARWTRTLNFEGGLYRFYVTVDDGLRLFVDGGLVIDEWRDGGQRQVFADRWLAAGKHTLRTEYYERSGTAIARLGWEKVATYPDWKGEYWSNIDLSGTPALVRNDVNLAFDWQQGSPGNAIPADSFSARWTRQVAFEAGTYRFHALVDDGVRLWLNDRPIIDAWSDHNAVELTADYALAQGTYTLKVEYYERIGNARIHVWWEKVPPSYPDWKGEYWPNRDLSGNVALVRNDRAIDFRWGPNAPAGGLPADNFSVRWTRKATFEATTYHFHALADDGVRLWVDGKLLIDAWKDQEPREWIVERAMVAGKREIVVEYYEHTGGARIKVWWEKVTPAYLDWRGEYWSNRDLDGSPVLVRNDRKVEFDWGTGPPATGLPGDNFSARWTRRADFQPGLYRLEAKADDGVRIYVDGRLVIDEWHSYRNQTYSVDLALSGAHQLEVKYYEKGGDARIRFSWKRIGDLPTPVPIPRVQFSSTTYNVDEGVQAATITVLLSGTYNRPVTVDYATAGGTASAGSDYVAANGRLTLEPGVTSRTLTLGILEDNQDEADETVILVLSNPANATLGSAYQTTLTIVDNDVPPPLPRIAFDTETYNVDEGAGTATIRVVLSGLSDRAVTVEYSTADGTASVGSDYEAAVGTLTFEPGVTSRTLAVSVLEDNQDEVDETVILVLSNPVNAALGPAYQVTLTIVDNDVPLPLPRIAFDAETYNVDEGAGTATIRVVLSGPYDHTVTVEYSTADGTASVGSDYEAAVGTLTFESGATEQVLVLPIVDDEQNEEEETIVLLLANPRNAELGAISQATLVIVDNDTLVPSLPPPGNLRLLPRLGR